MDMYVIFSLIAFILLFQVRVVQGSGICQLHKFTWFFKFISSFYVKRKFNSVKCRYYYSPIDKMCKSFMDPVGTEITLSERNLTLF